MESKYKIFTVTPTVQASPDYSDGDVLFSPTEISDVFPNKNSAIQIVSLFIIDKVAANTSDFTLYFTHSATSFGTVNDKDKGQQAYYKGKKIKYIDYMQEVSDRIVRNKNGKGADNIGMFSGVKFDINGKII